MLECIRLALAAILILIATACGNHATAQLIGQPAPLSLERRANAPNAVDQFLERILPLADGGYVVIWRAPWTTDSLAILAQRYAANNVPVGARTQVNLTIPAVGDLIHAVPLKEGGYVVAWSAAVPGNPGQLGDVYVQRFGTTNARVGPERRVNTSARGGHNITDLIALSDGGYVVVWPFTPTGIAVQRFAPANTRVGPNIVLDRRQTGLTRSIALKDGGYVIMWEFQQTTAGATSTYHFAQRFSADNSKVGDRFRINTDTAGFHLMADAVALPNGGYVALWRTLGLGGAPSDGSGSASFVQRFRADNRRFGGQTLVNTTTAGNQDAVQLLATSTGGYVAMWEGPTPDGYLGLYSQGFAANNTRIGGGEVRITIGRPAGGYFPWSRAAALPDGGYVVTWPSVNEQIGFQFYRILARRFTASNTPLGGEVQVSSGYIANPDFPRIPDVVPMFDGGYLVLWVDQDNSGFSTGVYARRFAADDTPVGGPFRINDTVSGPQSIASFGPSNAVKLADGSVAIAWNSFDGDSDTGVYSKRYRLRGRPYAAPNATRLAGATSKIIDVLANDIDPDVGGSLDIVSASADLGNVTINRAASRPRLRYTPPAGTFTGALITYVIEDASGLRATGQVTVRP